MLIFTVEKIEYTGDSMFMISGRNCDDKRTLFINNILTLRKSGKIMPIKLNIVKILWYGRNVDCVEPGHSAGLYFKIGIESQISLGDKLEISAQQGDAPEPASGDLLA